jgi:hypothetical protein
VTSCKSSRFSLEFLGQLESSGGKAGQAHG